MHPIPGARRRSCGPAVALLLSLVLMLSAAATPALARTEGPDPDQVEADAAAYLAGVHASGSLSGGALSDILFALVGAGEQPGVVAQAHATLEEELASAVAGGSTDPGLIGKGLLGVLAAGGDARDVDGVDVEAALRGLIGTEEGPDQGRIGSSSTFIQALGVMALAATADGAPASTTAWLAGNRCPDGGWVFSATCTTQGGGGVDTTALVLQALRDDPAQAPARDGALAWLLDQQDANDGSFGGNANSTGLAGQALRALGDADAADAAAAFVATLQIPAGQPDAGAIRYSPTTDGSLFLATSQGVLALGAPALQDLGVDATAPTGACTDTTGVTVVVDLTAFDEGILQGCAPEDPANGLEALTLAGFDIVTQSSDFGAYVCAIEGRPVAACDEPYTGSYWSYHEGDEDGSWTSYDVGAASSDPAPGDVEGWAYSDGSPPGIPAPVIDEGDPDPEPTDPEPTDPEPTDPEPTDPEPTDSEPSDPVVTDIVHGESCVGVAVVVDQTAFDEGVRQRCVAADPADGIEALELAGFDATTQQTDFGPFVCEIDGLPVGGCETTQRQGGYWAYFTGEPDGTWTASSIGAGDADPDPGAVEGWRYGTGEPPSVAAPGAVLRRLAGDSRITTAIDISRAAYAAGAAGAVVLVRADEFADGLAGTPLAVRADAPLLLTGADALDPAVAAEIQRVLPAGGTVHVLGGLHALSEAVATGLTDLGYAVDRVAGRDRVHTAIAIADALGDPARVLVTTASDFPDGLAAGAAAGALGDAAVLLTTPDVAHPAVDAYLAANADAVVTAVGGPAARAYPAAVAVAGETREETAIAVAEAFFDDPAVVGIARRDAFADALAGGADVARRGGPLLITPASAMDPLLAAFLCGEGSSAEGVLYGGEAALNAGVSLEVARALTGDAC